MTINKPIVSKKSQSPTIYKTKRDTKIGVEGNLTNIGTAVILNLAKIIWEQFHTVWLKQVKARIGIIDNIRKPDKHQVNYVQEIIKYYSIQDKESYLPQRNTSGLFFAILQQYLVKESTSYQFDII